MSSKKSNKTQRTLPLTNSSTSITAQEVKQFFSNLSKEESLKFLQRIGIDISQKITANQ